MTSDEKDWPLPVLAGNARRATSARVYNCLVGSKDYFEADRVAVEMLLEVDPFARHLAEANRTFVRRAVLKAAEAGVIQVVDIGCGFPGTLNLHELVLLADSAARFAYVDSDPYVVRHCEVFAADGDAVVAFRGDVRRPREILDNPVLSDAIDFSEPVAVVFGSVLHYVPDDGDLRDIIDAFRDVMAPGSQIILSHLTADGSTRQAYRSAESYSESVGLPVALRSADDLRGLLKDGFKLVDPGMASVVAWLPGDREPRRLTIGEIRVGMYGAVGIRNGEMDRGQAS